MLRKDGGQVDQDLLARLAPKKDVNDDEDEHDESCYSQMVLKSDSIILIIWNLFMSLLTIFQLMKTVFMLGFEMEIENVWVDFVIDIFFAIDIFVHFFVAHISDVEESTRFLDIFRNYVFGYFFFDAFATFPTLFTLEWKVIYWFKLF